MNKKIKIYYGCQTQYQNLGDLIINRLCLSEIRKRADVKCLTFGVPNYFLAGLELKDGESIESSFTFYIKLILDLVRGNDVVIWGKPGHIIHNKLSFRMLPSLIVKCLLRLLKARFVRIGSTFGPFNGLPLKVEKYCYNKGFLGVRDINSLIFCKKINFPNVDYCPDIALLSPYLNNDKKNNVIAFSFRANSTDLNSEVQGISQCLRGASSCGFDLTPVVQVSLDNQFMKKISDELSICSSFKQYPNNDEEEIFEIYKNSRIVVSNRLHVLIFAMSMGAIPIPIIDPAKNKKVAGVFTQIGLTELIFELNSISSFEDHLSVILNRVYDFEKIYQNSKVEISQVFDRIIHD